MLPGAQAQVKMSPPFRQTYTISEAKIRGAKESAVLILLYEKQGEVHLVFTERKVYKGAHSGQISFPGGKKDAVDISLEYTALRETHEEVGILASKIEVVSAISHLYIPVSNFLVFPFVGVLNEAPVFVKEEKEVERIIEIPLKMLLNSENEINKKIKIPEKNIQFNTPAYQVKDIEIWGATAMILSEFLEILKLDF